jgi:hypothetical protein
MSVIVAASALIAAAVWLADGRLRLCCGAVLLSALAWLLFWVVLVPWEESATARSGDMGSAIGDVVAVDCCNIALGGLPSPAVPGSGSKRLLATQAVGRPGAAARGVTS